MLARQAEQGWGANVIDRLANDLRTAFPEMKGFSPRNLKYMRAFAEAWPDAEIVQQVAAQLPWGHNLVLLDRLKASTERLAYARAAIEYGWSRNVLNIHIETRLLERTGKAVTNFDQRLPAPQPDLAIETLKDPYRFDFLGMGEEAQEREIEKALVQHVTYFLLELGAGFAFVGRQVLLDVGGEEFFIDLLPVVLPPQAALLCGDRTEGGQVQARTPGAIGLLPDGGGSAGEARAGQSEHWPAAVQKQEQGGGRVRPG